MQGRMLDGNATSLSHGNTFHVVSMPGRQNTFHVSNISYLKVIYMHISFLRPVPQPDVDITLSRTVPLYNGGSLTLTCTVTMDRNVDTSVMVVTEWNGPRDISGERYLTTPASGSGTTYTSSLTISHITDQDDGIYTCTVTVTGTSNTQLAITSNVTEIIVVGE